MLVEERAFFNSSIIGLLSSANLAFSALSNSIKKSTRFDISLSFHVPSSNLVIFTLILKSFVNCLLYILIETMDSLPSLLITEISLSSDLSTATLSFIPLAILLASLVCLLLDSFSPFTNSMVCCFKADTTVGFSICIMPAANGFDNVSSPWIRLIATILSSKAFTYSVSISTCFSKVVVSCFCIDSLIIFKE